MAVILKVTAFWDVTPCSLVDVYQHLKGHDTSTVAQLNLCC